MGQPDASNERQQRTLSVRISEALHGRLEGIREILSARSGTRITTSEVAKNILESAYEERLEFVERLKEPTVSLIDIRGQHEQGLELSKSDWTCVVFFVHQGFESAKHLNPYISKESLMGLVNAFLAAYKLLPESASREQEYYLGNFGYSLGVGDGQASSADVLKAAEHSLKQIEESRRPYGPTGLGRNLYALIEGEKFASIKALNKALNPFWTILWRLAARGHFAQCEAPIRMPLNPGEEHFEKRPYIPSVSESLGADRYSLSFQTLDNSDLSLLLVFPDKCGAMYPMSRYPMITAFRAMLDGLRSDQENEHWDTPSFFAYTGRGKDGLHVGFRAKDNGITFTFAPEEWTAIKRLFEKAWETPELNRVWEKLALEYGEL